MAWCQAITWTNADWSSVKSSNIHVRAISQGMPQPSSIKIYLKMWCLKFHSNFPVANELMKWAPGQPWFYILSLASLGLKILHYNDVIMSMMASQITSLRVVYSTVYSGADQGKHQSSASLAFARGIYRRPVNSLHKGLVMRKMFPFDDIIMSIVSAPFSTDFTPPQITLVYNTWFIIWKVNGFKLS